MTFQKWEDVQEWAKQIESDYTIRQQYQMTLEKLGEFILTEPDNWYMPFEGEKQRFDREAYRQWQKVKETLVFYLQSLAQEIRAGFIMSSDVPPLRTNHIEKDADNE